MSRKWSGVPEVPRLHERSPGATTNFGTYPEASDFRERVFGRPAAQTGFARIAGRACFPARPIAGKTDDLASQKDEYEQSARAAALHGGCCAKRGRPGAV
jgi:hypothetical protein